MINADYVFIEIQKSSFKVKRKNESNQAPKAVRTSQLHQIDSACFGTLELRQRNLRMLYNGASQELVPQVEEFRQTAAHHLLSNLNLSNRRMRTRMSGGVAGDQRTTR
jgi:hypothetical protein